MDLAACPPEETYLVDLGDDVTQTFLDLVDDSSSFDPHSLSLRIKGGSRRPWNAAESLKRSHPPLEKRHTMFHELD